MNTLSKLKNHFIICLVMGSFCAVVPDRGDRKELMSFCRHQLERMTVKPDKVYFVDHPPENGTTDLTGRIRTGIKKAKEDNIERVFIVEDRKHKPGF